MSEPVRDRSLLDSVVATIIGSGRRFGKAQPSTIEEDCRTLLDLGPDAGKRVAVNVLASYADLSEGDRLAFFRFLNDELDVDTDAIEAALGAYEREKSADNLRRLLAASEPRRQELLRRLNAQRGATNTLVDMRADLLRAMVDEPDLRRADQDFAHLFQSWFNRGFLDLQPITWDTSASLLAKIIAYEAVHEINGWNDLRSRLEPPDRLCYAFVHPAMPGEPLVFTEVALMSGTPSNVQTLLSEEREAVQPEAADTAVFYSISNCQRGLRGISFGNLLIKQVVADLRRALPNLKTFLTLSPVPGFAKWLTAQDEAPEQGAGLLAPAAHYLTQESRADGQPLDPVARFHLSNGAELYAIHLDADTSENGRQASHGVMVNYRYDLARVEANQEAFGANGTVFASRAVKSHASRYRPRAKDGS